MKTLKSILFLLVLLNFQNFQVVFAQEKQDLDKNPLPVGGINGIMEKVVYPEKAKQLKVQGMVHIKAVVDEKGDVEKAIVEKSENELLNTAALSAVKLTKFFPGEKEGKKVKSEVVVPILFKLR